jgi:hypothetical protein
MMGANPKDDYSKEEAEHRLVAALRGARVVGHKPQSEMKLGKPTAKRKTSPSKRKAVKK